MTTQAIRYKPQGTQNAVHTDQMLVTEQQSLQACQQVVEATIGNIGYLRGLFPEDCFAEDRIQGGTTKIKRIVRGVSKEADRFVDYVARFPFPSARLLFAVPYAI